MTAPKLFVSYSWTDQEHMDWVVQLATDLRSNGVDTILDKWHLREGQDAHAFMEQMVTNTNVSKVLLVCDRKYVERADQRLGGVGAESQIISSELYGKIDQTKFVAVCRENDENGRAILPIFMRSRIYIDFIDRSQYSERFEQLLRWCFDKPLYIEPEIGQAPAFLDDKIAPVSRRRADFERSNRSGILSGHSTAIRDFFRGISAEDALPGIQQVDGMARDEEIYLSIIGLSPLIFRVLQVFEESVRRDDSTQVAWQEMHRYLEFVMSQYDKGSSSWSGDLLKFYAKFVLVSSVSILVDNGRYDACDELLGTPFVLEEYGGMTAKGYSFGRVGSYLNSLEARNDRLQLRRLSLHADLIKQVCESSGVSFRNFVQADLALFIRASTSDDRWWPDSVVYVSDAHGALPWYVRATSEKTRNGMMSILGIRNKESLEKFISKVRSREIRDPQWGGGWGSADTIELANLVNIAESWQ